jgi:hypothetical protein
MHHATIRPQPLIFTYKNPVLSLNMCTYIVVLVGSNPQDVRCKEFIHFNSNVSGLICIFIVNFTKNNNEKFRRIGVCKKLSLE